MLPYFLLLLIPLALQSLMKAGNVSVRLSDERILSWDNIAQPVFFTLFFLILVLRHKYLGRDLRNYYSIFNSFGALSLRTVFSEWREALFRFYCWAFYRFISKNYQLFISFTAAVSVIPIAYVYSKDKSHGYMKVAIFVNMSTFIMLFSGIRQGLAMAVGMLAYRAVKDKRNFLFLLLSVIAVLFHHTGFMVFLLWPLYNMRFHETSLLWIIPLVALVIAFNAQIFNSLASLATEILEDETYSTQAEDIGAYMSFVLFALYTAFCYIVEDETRMDEEAFGLRNILTFSMIIQTFTLVNSLAMRMNYYFILLIPMAMGKSLNCVKPGMEQVAKAGEIVISVFLTLYFFNSIYNSYITGVSTLDTIPYVPFWGKMY